MIPMRPSFTQDTCPSRREGRVIAKVEVAPQSNASDCEAHRSLSFWIRKRIQEKVLINVLKCNLETHSLLLGSSHVSASGRPWLHPLQASDSRGQTAAPGGRLHEVPAHVPLRQPEPQVWQRVSEPRGCAPTCLHRKLGERGGATVGEALFPPLLTCS